MLRSVFLVFQVLAMLAVCNSSFAQSKMEKEIRVDAAAVPKVARVWLANLDITSRVKWYLEKNQQDSSYEAKTKYRKQFLSIEFSKSGNFEDLEIRISEQDIPSIPRQAIQKHLQEKWGRFAFKRTQLQLVGSQPRLKAYLTNEDLNEALTVAYELVVAVKDGGKYHQYEYLFDDQGNMLKKARVIRAMSDNLEY